MNRVTLILVSILILLFFFVSCDKYHRNRYVGDWEFVTKRSYEGVFEKSETINYSGKIRFGNSDNEIFIKYTENDEISAWLEEMDNHMYIHTLSRASYGGKYSSGSFDDKNNMSIYYSYRTATDSNGINIIDIIGDKITGTKKERRQK